MPLSRTLTLFILFLLITTAAQQVLGQSRKVVPAFDQFTTQRSSLSLIDDIINLSNSQEHPQHPASTIVARQASSEQDTTCGQCRQALREADVVVASLQSSENKCSCPLESQSEHDAFHKQMAALLSITLNSPGIDQASKERAIDAAMKMVAKNATLASSVKMAQLQVEHAQAMMQMNKQFSQRTMPETPVPVAAWMQLQRQSRRNPLANTEANSRAKQNLAKQKLIDEQIRRIVEAKQLRQEIKKLDQRIEELISNPIRPANFLEPLYAPDQPLKPLLAPN